jgi:hypothetical protein
LAGPEEGKIRFLFDFWLYDFFQYTEATHPSAGFSSKHHKV